MSDHTGVDGEGRGATPTGSGCRPADRAAARPAPAGFHPSRAVLAQALYATSNRLVSSRLPAGWVPPGLHDDPMAAEVHYAYADAAMALFAPGGEAALADETGTGSAEGEHPVPGGQAPDQISDLKAENERLRIIIRDREWKRDLADREVDQLSGALAESERKRVEAEARNTAFAGLMRLVRDYAIDQSMRATIDDLLGINALLATPTQETTHVEI